MAENETKGATRHSVIARTVTLDETQWETIHWCAGFAVGMMARNANNSPKALARMASAIDALKAQLS